MTAFVAYLCSTCHEMVDAQRTSHETAMAIWMEAHKRSIPLFKSLLDDRARELLREDE